MRRERPLRSFPPFFSALLKFMRFSISIAFQQSEVLNLIVVYRYSLSAGQSVWLSFLFLFSGIISFLNRIKIGQHIHDPVPESIPVCISVRIILDLLNNLVPVLDQR